MEKNRTAALVVTYNRKDLLLENIEALQNQTEPVDIWVIDNASTDGTQELLQPFIKGNQIIYRNTERNLGGAGGFNYALKQALQRDYDYFWLMDDDTIPNKDAHEKLLVSLKTKEATGFLSSRVLWTDGNQCLMNEQKLLENNLKTLDHDSRCRQASFVSMFVPASTVKEVGLPIKEFFIWGDDVEYTRRISKRFPSWFVPSSVVVHKTANNAGSNIARDDLSRLSRYRYAYRNEVYIARHEGLQRMAYQAAKIIYHTGRVLISGKPAKLKKIRLIWSASLEGVSFNPAIEFEKGG